MPLFSSSLLLRAHALTTIVISYFLLFQPSLVLSSGPIWILGESMHIRPATYLHLLPDSSSSSASKPPSRKFSPPSLRAAVSSISPSSATTTATLEVLAIVALMLTLSAISQFLFAGDLAVPSSNSTDSSSQNASTTSTSKSKSKSKESSSASSQFGEQIHTLHSSQTRYMTLAALRVLLMAALTAWIYVFHSDRNHQTSPNPAAAATSMSGFSLLANRVVFAGAMTDMLFWGYLWTVIKEEARLVAAMVGSRREAEEMD